MNAPLRVAAEQSSGNVFADLGFPDAIELDAKVSLVVEIFRLLKARRLTAAESASLLKISATELCALKNYALDGISMERLLTFLAFLGQYVAICFKARRTSRGVRRIRVSKLSG